MRTLGFVTVVHDRPDHLRRQQLWLDRCAPGCSRVVVAMDDESVEATLESVPALVVHVDGEADRLPVARARNVGAQRAVEAGADTLVFLDVDCIPTPDLVTMYAEHLGERMLLSGPVTYLPEGVLPPDDADPAWFAANRRPHPARPDPPYGTVVTGADPDLFWSLSFAVTAATFEELGGFHEEYEGYGGEDTDLGWSARDAGMTLAWMGGADAFHQWHPVSDPPVEHVEDILRNGRIFFRRWGRWPMEGWLRALAELGMVQQQGDQWCAVEARDSGPVRWR